jgi:hypothetical protein
MLRYLPPIGQIAAGFQADGQGGQPLAIMAGLLQPSCEAAGIGRGSSRIETFAISNPNRMNICLRLGILHEDARCCTSPRFATPTCAFPRPLARLLLLTSGPARDALPDPDGIQSWPPMRFPDDARLKRYPDEMPGVKPSRQQRGRLLMLCSCVRRLADLANHADPINSMDGANSGF